MLQLNKKGRCTLKAQIVWYAINVLVVAVPLALFEIWLERFKTGWGGEFRSPFWGYKITWRPLCLVMQKTYVTPYHLLMFGLVIPVTLVAQCWLTPLPVVGPVYFLALWIGVATLEDFLWAALNWHYPRALHRMFHQGLSWHTKWIELTQEVKVPRFYITSPFWIAILLVIQHLIIRLGHS